MALELKDEIPAADSSALPGEALKYTGLLHKDTTPLAADETRTAEINISHCKSLGGSIYADQACTLKCYYGQDGSNYGDAQELAVSAGQTLEIEADPIYSRALKIEVVNGATEMTAFRLHLRGRA